MYRCLAQKAERSDMKAASTVFNVLSILIYIIAWIAVGKQPNMGLAWIFFLPAILVCLVSIIVTHSASHKGGGYIFQGILDIIFGSLLAGIFMLCVNESDMHA